MFHKCPPSQPFTLRVARAAAELIRAGGVGRGGLRLGRAPQEERHELRGVYVRHEGFGVDVELMAEGRAQGLTLGLGPSHGGSVPNRGQTQGLHVHLVPAVGRRVAAAAAGIHGLGT